MSAAPRLTPGIAAQDGIVGLRMTAEEYLAIGASEERTELIEGGVVMSPSPTPAHQKLIRLIVRQLEAFAGDASGLEIYIDTDLRLSSRLVYRPDVLVYRPGRIDDVPARLDVPPDLVVEVLSGSNRAYDLVTNRGDYERFGVAEYWVVDPETGGVRCWSRPASDAAMDERTITADRVDSVSLAGFALDLRPIRALAAK